jgi:hypothetical protein
MRLWSLHPRYLDSKGLVALWREALLAQAVLRGQTKGYRHHPQLSRFRQAASARLCIAAYLHAVLAEAVRRGFNFDASKASRRLAPVRLVITSGQLEYEWAHLRAKLAQRAPSWLAQLPPAEKLQPHPLFRVVRGDIAEWEKRVTAGRKPGAATVPGSARRVAKKSRSK